MTEQANCFGGRVDGRLRGGWVGKFDALEMIGDVGRGGVDAVEGIEKAHGRTGAGIGRCSDSSIKHPVVGPADAIGCKRRARHLTLEPLTLPGIFGGERLSEPLDGTGRTSS